MKNLLIGVTGSVATVKLGQLTTALSTRFNIQIIATASAHYFLHELDKTKLRILNDNDDWPDCNDRYVANSPILHIELRRWADVLLIAPLDAHTLAKICLGLCDNLLTNVVRAWDWQKPFYFCPAMNTAMWNNPPTAEHIQTLQERGALCIHPIEKKLACNDIGMGAMAEVESIKARMLNDLLV